MILRKAFPNWKTDGGIFHELNTHTETPWRGVIDPNTLDLDYYGNRSGGKIVSVLVGVLADGEPLKTSDVETLALLLLSKYGLSWSRMWDAVTSEYDPVSNYDMVETENINRQSNGGYGSTVNNSGTSENGIFGFNSADAVPSNNSSDTGNTTTTGTTNNTDVDARTLTRKGNVGVTAGYQLVGGELDVRMRNFFNLVYDNIDEVLTIPVYGDCDETDEHGDGSTYVLPPATRTTLGGVIVGDGLQVTENGVLSAEQGAGAVESVNGKTGAVVLTYDDVGAPSLDEFQQIEDDTDENTRMINENAVNIAQNTEDIQIINGKVPFRFGVDSDGNYGYYKAGADTVTPFKSGGSISDVLRLSNNIGQLLPNNMYISGAGVLTSYPTKLVTYAYDITELQPFTSVKIVEMYRRITGNNRVGLFNSIDEGARALTFNVISNDSTVKLEGESLYLCIYTGTVEEQDFIVWR